MGALCKLTWSGDRYYDDGWKDTPPVTLDTAMTEADFSNKHLGASGAIILAAVLRCKTFRGSGALSKLDISGNQICGLNKYGNGTYDTSGLAALAKSIGNLKELNISSNCLKAEGAKVLAPALQDSGSLSKLDLSGNDIGGYGGSADAMTALGASLVACVNVTDLDISKNDLRAKDISGFAEHLKDMGALSKLDISSNGIGNLAGESFKQICTDKSIQCTLDHTNE
jgi:Ran GTPase-activating protein (RanGAP) involved in mRNA processing and transport